MTKKLLEYDRFRKVISHNPTTKVWSFEDAEYDMKRLFSSTIVDGDRELMDEVSKISRENLRGYGEIPSWHIRKVQNQSDGPSALVFRIHHVIGDGMSLVCAMSKLFTDRNGNSIQINIPGKLTTSVDGSATVPREDLEASRQLKKITCRYNPLICQFFSVVRS